MKYKIAGIAVFAAFACAVGAAGDSKKRLRKVYIRLVPTKR